MHLSLLDASFLRLVACIAMRYVCEGDNRGVFHKSERKYKHG